MRISDWSSDVCSSDLPGPIRFGDCPRNPWIYIARAHSTKRRHGHVDAVMQQERPPPYWRGTEQTVVVVLGHARDKLLPAHKSGLGFPRLERPGEVFVDRPLIIRKLVQAAKAEGFWQEAPDIGVSGRPAETL